MTALLKSDKLTQVKKALKNISKGFFFCNFSYAENENRSDFFSLARKVKMQDPIYITKEGLEKLKEELRNLKEERIPEVARRIQVARDNGDISENAEYDAAKHEQAITEGKIKELEDIIKNAKISKGSSNEVTVGSKVKVHVDGDEMELQIVGEMESNPAERKVSHSSPIGSALVGKKVGDKVEVEAPIGSVVYTILSIK